jgi:prepilin-type N-terminal cleavage/methylation domain-containing protein/prepilin-type processing-associated H-X9-DG protein
MKQAFTLIELLIVIAIIAILAGIMFPVFARAHEFAHKAGCIGNFKQFGVAFALYGNDFDDSLINPGQYDNDPTDIGQQALDPYVRVSPGQTKESIYLCPSDTKVYFQTTLLGGPADVTWKGYPTTYGMNVFLQPPNQQDPDPDACFTPPSQQLSVSWYGTPYSNESNLFDNGMKMNVGGLPESQIDMPASTDLLFESVVEGGSNSGYVGVSQRGGDYMNVQGFFQTQDQANHWYSPFYTLQPATNPWHIQLNNYLFADGHCQGRVPERVQYDITAHPMDNIWMVHDGREGGAPAPAGGC